VGYCIGNHEDHPELSDNLNYFVPQALPLFFGVAVFDFEGNGVIINLHASMQEPEKFNQVLVTTLTIYVTALCTFCSIAYWSYGPNLEDMVTLNLPHDNLTSMI
jgi:solute carrier family 36 (proton-coupled amino acid transporter)